MLLTKICIYYSIYTLIDINKYITYINLNFNFDPTLSSCHIFKDLYRDGDGWRRSCVKSGDRVNHKPFVEGKILSTGERRVWRNWKHIFVFIGQFLLYCLRSNGNSMFFSLRNISRTRYFHLNFLIRIFKILSLLIINLFMEITQTRLETLTSWNSKTNVILILIS